MNTRTLSERIETIKIGGGRINLLYNFWETERLIVEDVNPNEINEIQQIYETSSNIEIWDGVKTEADYVLNCYRKGDLPPGGNKENYKMQSIKIKTHVKKLIGVICIYHGYPIDSCIYISSMCIKNDYKKNGFGQEIIGQLNNELKRLGYKKIKINVSLKNWSALRFWIKQGFNNINGIHGDRVYSEKTFASLELTRIL